MTALRVARRYLALQRRALVMPPRRLVHFVKIFEKEVAKGFGRLQASLEALGSVARSSEGTISLSEVFEQQKLPNLSRIVETMKQRATDTDFAFYTFERMASERKHFRIEDKIAMNLVETLERATDGNDPVNLRDIARRLSDLGAFTWDAHYEEGLAPDLRSALEVVASAAESLAKGIDAKLAPLRAFTSGDVKPEATETLYHASVKARDIYQKGFQAELPKDQIGLGGSQSTRSGKLGISFTYDLRAALDIARSFKEVAMIVTGEIKASDVLDWGLREKDMEEFMLQLNARKKNLHELVHDGRRWVLKVTTLGRGTEEKDIDDVLKDPIDVFNIYDAYLYTQRSRVNPVHMNRYKLLEFLKNADPRDIGVVSAEVDMSHPDVSSHPGEREFRIPPAAVKRILRFYGS